MNSEPSFCTCSRVHLEQQNILNQFFKNAWRSEGISDTYYYYFFFLTTILFYSKYYSAVLYK